MTTVDACHLLAPGAVAAETATAAEADYPCPSSALSSVNELALADGAATATCNMDDSGWHMLAGTREGLVAWGGGLTVVDWLRWCHVHGRGIMVSGRDVVSRGLVVRVVFSVMCHLYYFINI